MSRLKLTSPSLKADLMSQLTWRMFGMVVGLMVGIASLVAVVQSVFD